MIYVAKIVNTHGTQGEVKAVHYTDGEPFFKHVKTLYKKDGAPLKIRSWRFHKGSVLLTIEGFCDMTVSETLRNTELYAREEDLPPLGEGKYYFFQLKGLTGVLPDGKEFGIVSDIIENTASNLLEFKTEKGRKILIPNIPVFVKNVDLKNGKIYISPIEGLIDDEI